MSAKPFKIFKVSLYDSVEGSQGFEFKTSHTAAKKYVAEYVRGEPKARSAFYETILVVPTKGGIVAALNRHAGHPDNG